MYITKRALYTVLLTTSINFIASATEKSTPILIRDANTLLPIPGVTVENLTKKIIGFTSDDGVYLFTSTNEEEVKVIFSSIGYYTREVILNSNNLPSFIDLELDDNILEGIVVTGYTTQSKTRTTGAVGQIDAKAINKIPVASADQILQGQVAGLHVASPSGQPGAMGRVTIRGIGSLQDENTNPLYILNGLPISPETFSLLNPEDFEEITVLKDAAATAPYGSRGANGVIVITSKKGVNNNGDLKVVYQTQYGYSAANNSKWDMMNTNQRLQFEEMLQDNSLPGWAYSRNNPYKIINGQKNLKTEQDYIEGDNALVKLRSTNIDWRNKILRKGISQLQNLIFSGGTDKTQHYTSLNYFNQQGVLHSSGIERFNLNSNIHHQSGVFKANFFVNLAQVNNRLSESDFDISETNPVASMYFALPYENPYDAEGNLIPGVNRFGTNALAMYNDISRKEKQMRGVVLGNFSYDLIDEFKLISTLGIDYAKIGQTHIVKPDTYFGELIEEGGRGLYSQEDTNNIGIMTNFGVNYKKVFGFNEIEVIALAEMNRHKRNYYGFTGYGLIGGLDQTPGGITPGTPDNDFIPKIMGGASESILLSQLVLMRYSYQNKYTVSGSFRRDGSSRVPTDNRYRNFYAFGANWNVKHEDFLQKIEVLSALRLRASYGLTGNANGFASDFGYRRLFGSGQYNGQSGLVPITPGNLNYNWEINKIADIGLEFGLFSNRLVGEIDFYNRVTSNLFMDRSLSMTSGFESIADNVGKIRNRGIEIRLSGDIVKEGNFVWNMGINFAYNKNKILSLGDEDEIITEDYSIHKVGKSFGHFYMVRWAGVDSQTGSPLYYDKDGEITTVYDAENAVLVKGVFDPAIKGGFTTNFKYKNWEVGALFSFIKGMYRLNTGQFYRTSADANHRIYNQSVSMLNMWQKPGDVSDNPDPSYARYITDRELQKADYLKLRNVFVNYKFTNLGRANKYIKELSVFAQGQNLITWTAFKGQDPEDDNNIYQYEYPLPRTVTAGIKVTF